jgi:hypothetical protein
MTPIAALFIGGLFLLVGVAVIVVGTEITDLRRRLEEIEQDLWPEPPPRPPVGRGNPPAAWM